ncbi:BatD family protein [Hydrocarboniclastica marina]|uniref:Protein BatD n=1 Tax=Hydrocarboniclastica marina TaxID=2259620 RepID=A0A4V1D8M5_9ALTE|nr:BatD family protein [Hydrocarboniclastica marina]QCF25710.1 protein BatD [Hydrocarboniclastica marina]
MVGEQTNSTHSIRLPSDRIPHQLLSSMWVLLYAMVLLWPAAATAAEKLEASVNRNALHEDETLTLTVQGEMEIELNLGSIMSLRNLDLPEPDLGNLTDSFEILDQRQAYSLRSVNGEHSAEVTWTFQLAPRRSGSLTIPSLSFKNAQSQPIQVEVNPGSSPQAAAGAREAWVEAEVDKSRVFVQEQLVYTLRLYYRGSLIGGNLSEPSFDNAVVEPLGEQQQTTARIGNNRYQVVERRYLVYPERTGELTLPSQQFTGRQRDPATGTLEFLRAQSKPLTVEVVPPPSDFPGDTWVPAESLVLDESWSNDPETLQVGDSVTRTLTLKALGLLETALPRLAVDYPAQFRVYPESPAAKSEIKSGTVESTQTQSAVLMAVEPGSVTLPEVRLHWWDTVNDRSRVAVIPARTLTVAPAPGSDGGTSAIAQADRSDSRASAAGSGTAGGSPQAANGSESWLAWVAAFFALAWMITLWLWLRKRKPGKVDTGSTKHNTRPTVDLDRLKRYAIHGHVDTLRLIPAWVRETFHQPQIHTLKETRDFFNDSSLNQSLDALEQFLYSGGETEWKRGKELAATLERLKQNRGTTRSKDSALPPFSKRA